MSAGHMVIVLDFTTLDRGMRGSQWTVYPPGEQSYEVWNPRAVRDRNGNPQVWLSFGPVGANDEFEPYGNGLVQIRLDNAMIPFW